MQKLEKFNAYIVHISKRICVFYTDTVWLPLARALCCSTGLPPRITLAFFIFFFDVNAHVYCIYVHCTYYVYIFESCIYRSKVYVHSANISITAQWTWLVAIMLCTILCSGRLNYPNCSIRIFCCNAVEGLYLVALTLTYLEAYYLWLKIFIIFSFILYECDAS